MAVLTVKCEVCSRPKPLGRVEEGLPGCGRDDCEAMNPAPVAFEVYHLGLGTITGVDVPRERFFPIAHVLQDLGWPIEDGVFRDEPVWVRRPTFERPPAGESYRARDDTYAEGYRYGRQEILGALGVAAEQGGEALRAFVQALLETEGQ